MASPSQLSDDSSWTTSSSSTLASSQSLELPYFDRLVAAMRALHAEEKQWGKVFMDDCGRLLPLKDAVAAADATWMSATLHGNTQALTSPLRATQQR